MLSLATHACVPTLVIDAKSDTSAGSTMIGSGATGSTGAGGMTGAGGSGNACGDVLTDDANCGVCGNACAFNASCVAGTCAALPCHALTFDGKDDYVTVPASADFAYGAEFTVEWWMRANAGVDYPRILSHEATMGAPNTLYTSWSIDGVNKLGQVRFQTANNMLTQASTTLVALGEWAHVAAVITGGNKITLFVNGAKSDTRPAAFSGDTTQVALGIGAQLKYLTDYPYGGGIGPLRLSKVARYAGAFSPTWGWKADGDTLAVWNMFEGAGTTLLDQSAGKHDGTLVGPGWETLAVCPGGS